MSEQVKAVDGNGGFLGTEAALEERQINAAIGLTEHPTVLDGQGKVLHVVTGASDALLDGVVVQGGKTSTARAAPKRPPANRKQAPSKARAKAGVTGRSKASKRKSGS